MELQMKLEKTINEGIDRNSKIISTNNYDIELGEKELTGIIATTIDRGSDYIIKSLPIADAYKDILVDIKEHFKDKGFKDLIKTVVNSSIREGMEIIGIPQKSIKNLTGLEKTCEKGGLNLTLQGIIGVVENDVLKDRIMGDYVYDYFNKMKEYVLSNKFLEKIRSSVNRYDVKSQHFIDKCDKWYNEYEKGNYDLMLDTYDSLRKNYSNVRNNSKCKEEYDIINNLTKLCVEKENLKYPEDINIIKNL